jgi:hypothetical protein
MAQKITSSTPRSGAATSSTQAAPDQKRRARAQHETRRQSFATHLQSHQSDQHNDRLQGEQHAQRDTILTRHDTQQLLEESASTRHEQMLTQDVHASDGFEQRLQDEASTERTAQVDEPTPDAPDVPESMDSPTPSHAREERLGEARPIEGVQQADASASRAQDVEDASQAASPQDVQQIAQMAEQLVKACSVGEDKIARKVMMLDVEVPGKGQMRVRLTRDGDGINVRLRASNDSTRSWLKAHQGRLRDEAASQGVVFKHIEVV